jgi:hypothetical protein
MAKQAPAPVKQEVKHTPMPYLIVITAWLSYAFISLTSPINQTNNSYNLSPQAVLGLRLSIILPYLLIWLAAVYSYLKVGRYAQLIPGTNEGRAFKHLAWGLLVLLGSLIVSTFLSTARSSYGVRHPDVVPALTILTNLSYVLPYLMAFGQTYFAAQLLKPRSDVLGFSVVKLVAWSMPLAVLAYFWLEAIFHNVSRRVSSGSGFASYYMPDSLIILLIVVPSLTAWALGLLTVLSFRNYKLTSKGVIYRAALGRLVKGIAGVVLASILLQVLLSLGSSRLLGLSLEAVLGIIYLFVGLQTFGFFYIAKGAQKLAKIETV